MPTVTKSATVTNLEAQPITVVSSRVLNGVIKGILDTVEVPNTAAGDSVILSPISVDATLLSIKVASDDAGGTGTFTLGFHKKNNDGTYTAVLAAAIATGVDNSGQTLAMTDYRFSVLNIDTVQKRIWELAGLSVRPAYNQLYFSVTPDGNDTTIGTLSLQASYME